MEHRDSGLGLASGQLTLLREKLCPRLLAHSGRPGPQPGRSEAPAGTAPPRGGGRSCWQRFLALGFGPGGPPPLPENAVLFGSKNNEQGFKWGFQVHI